MMNIDRLHTGSSRQDALRPRAARSALVLPPDVRQYVETDLQGRPMPRSQRLQHYLDLGLIDEEWAAAEPEAAERDADELAGLEAEED
jgi:hypothetical protein